MKKVKAQAIATTAPARKRTGRTVQVCASVPEKIANDLRLASELTGLKRKAIVAAALTAHLADMLKGVK